MFLSILLTIRMFLHIHMHDYGAIAVKIKIVTSCLIIFFMAFNRRGSPDCLIYTTINNFCFYLLQNDFYLNYKLFLVL